MLIYRGLLLTSASRAVVFLYTAPFFVALGSYLFLGERLRASQWGGLALCFAGVALAIGVPQANVDANVLLGDLLIVGGGALWAATTLLVKATALIKAPAEKGLGYQVALSIPILGLAALFSHPWFAAAGLLVVAALRLLVALRRHPVFLLIAALAVLLLVVVLILLVLLVAGTSSALGRRVVLAVEERIDVLENLSLGCAGVGSGIGLGEFVADGLGILDDAIDGLQAQRVQLGRGLLERVDFVGVKLVVRAFIPVGFWGRMKDKPYAFHAPRPVGSASPSTPTTVCSGVSPRAALKARRCAMPCSR